MCSTNAFDLEELTEPNTPLSELDFKLDLDAVSENVIHNLVYGILHDSPWTWRPLPYLEDVTEKRYKLSFISIQIYVVPIASDWHFGSRGINHKSGFIWEAVTEYSDYCSCCSDNE